MEAPRMFLVCLLVFLLCTPSLCQLCSNGQMRLVGGANQTQGRVEVCISNTWGTICDDNWSSEDARVVCSQLGYPSEGAQSYSFAAFGKGSGPIWFSDVQCSGAEVSLQKCFKGPVGAAYCSHQEDAGVLCTKASAGSQLFPLEDRDYLPFISLGTINGIPTLPVPKVDDGYSSPIYVSQSFPFNSASGIQYANTAYVGTNGYVSLNMGVNDYQPQLFPYSTLNLVAPFWADTYIVDGPGQILYEVHTTNASLVPLTRVSGFISRQLGIPFSGSWMLVAHYDHVLPFGYTDSSATNTFQAILITNGSQSYAVFTYKCGEMRWSGQATIGFGFSGSIFKNFPLSGTINDTSVACLKMPATNWSNLIYPLSDATIQSPVFEFTTSNISLQDMPISILLNVSVLPYSIDQGLSALVLVDPNMAYFDRGFFNGYTWSFGPADFGRVLLYLPQHYLGSVRLNATAYNGLQTTNVYLSIYVQPVPTAPNLVVNSPICFNQSDQMIHITIIASLVDTNASETLYVYISNVSKYLTISNLTRNSKNEYVFNATQIPVTQLQVTGTFTTIGSLNMTVSAQAVLLTNGNKAYNNVSVVINACEYCNDGELRLVGGLSSLEGRVEVCYGNKWGGICSPNYYYWGTYEASAVCRQLGFYPYDAITFNNGYFGIGPTTYYLSVDYCDYRAEGLLDCYYHEPNYYYYYYSIATLGSYSCNYGLKDFAVRCLDPSPEYCGGQCTNGSIRLVGGPSAHEGRIEVCIGGCWGTVCANGFSNNEASVACKQLGFRYDGALQRYYGSGSGPIWLTGLICSGNESSLFDCGYRSDYEDAIFYCNHGNDVGIFCQVFSNCTDGDIRLVNGQSSRDGILEICYSSQWGSVCGYSEWTSNPSSANTVCKQLGYGENNAIAYTNYSAAHMHPIWADIHCDARAKRLLDCISNNQIGFQYYYYYCNIAGVICQENKTRICDEGSVQLVGGSTPYDGKVLVCGRGSWGTVCGYNWDSLDAAVVCRQLGYPSLGAFPYSNAGQNYNIDGVPIWLYNLNCSGNEQELTNCSVVKVSYDNCNHHNDATVRCPDQSPTQHCTNGKVRLVNGSVPSEGRVEMCYDGQWGTMCGYESITTYSSVICRQLGYSPYGANVYHNSFFGEGSGGILLYTPNLLCMGNERSLPDCAHAPVGFHLCNDHSNDVGVSCQATFNNTSECRSGSIRLVGGNYANQGTVEFCIGGTWNTICGYPGDWNETNSLVLCNQLGIKNSIPTTYFYSYFGQGSGFTLQLQAACTGNESSVFQCPPKSSTYYFQLYTDTCNNHYYDIGIQCSNDNVGDSLLCGDGDIRLVNQINAMDGVVEICYQNQWSTVCGDYAWTDDTSGAITACKQLGYSNTTGIPYDQYGYYGPTNISNVHCDARNSRLIDCDHNTALSYCYSVAAVRCQGNFTRQCEEGSLSLVRGSTPYEGTVQVCGNGIWGTVCSTYWNSLAASVVCHQLGYGDFGAIAYPYSYFGQSFGPIWLHNLHCSGNEQSLFNCSIFNITSDVNCYHNSDPGVICPGPSPIQNCTDGDVRLVGGSVPSQGRVELCYKGHWGTICGQYGDISTYTNVICRQLGYSPYNAVTYYYYGQGSGGIFLYTPTLLCIGNEKTLLDCYHPPIGYHECGSHSTDIGVTCQVNAINISQCTSGEIRLVGGSTNYEGRVEFCIGDTWFALCGYPWSWDSTNAAVLCDQFGLQSSDPVMLFDQYFGHGTGSLLQLNPLCTGNEGSLLACPSSEYNQGVNYAHYYSCYSNLYSDLGVRCGNITALPLNCSNGDLRLTDGDSEFNGRVEVCYGNQWGTVCGDNSWTSDTSGASTVCKQLGYSPINATPFALSLPRSGSHYLLLSAVHCDARVTRLIDCFHDPFNSSYCSYGAASVSCEAISNTSECLDGAVRLVGGPTPYEGRVEVCARGTWGTICSNSNVGNGWSSLDGSVVCHQLGFPSIGPIIYSSTWQYGIRQGPIWLYNIRCSGDEEELFDCPFNNPSYSLYCDHHNDAGVMCQAPSPPQNCTDGDVQLVGGYAPSVGRVEMCYNKQWGTICGTYNVFTSYSNVICKQLGYSPYNATVYYNSYFGQGSGGIFLDTATLLCTGNETNLLDCYHSTVGYHQCGNHYADIGIACQASTSFIPQCESGAIHLMGGSDTYEGRVEYCIMGTWTSICAYPSSWNTSNSLVVCNELGFNTSRATSYFNGYFGYGTGSSLQVQALCTGNESSLFRCRSYDTNYDFVSFQTCYDHSYDLGVKCKEFCHDGDVRLLNGTTHSEGRVQFCYNGHWISIYGHPYAHWRTAEANVVCRQLGFAPFGATIYRDNRYGIGTGQDSLTNVFCNGYETDLQFCQYQINGYLNYAYYTAAISCKENCNECFDGSIRLVEGITIRDGRLEVCSAGCWTGVCIPEQGWSAQDATVACKQLQLNSSVAIPRYYYSKTSTFGVTPQCNGSETSLFQCLQLPCHKGRYNSAGVECPVTVATNTGVNVSATTSFSLITGMRSSAISLLTSTGALTHSASFSVSLSQSSQTITSTLSATSNPMISNSIGISTLQKIANTFVTNIQLSSHTIQSPSSMIIMPTTSSVFGTTSSVQLNGPSQSFLLQTIASTFDATIQTSTAFPNTNEASLSLAPTTTRAYGTTSEIVKMSPSPSLQIIIPTTSSVFGTTSSVQLNGPSQSFLLQTIASTFDATIQTSTTFPNTNEASLSLAPTTTRAYGTTSEIVKMSPSPSLQIIIPTTSSVFGTTSSVQLNGPSQSFLLQTIASTFDATIQTSTAFPNTNEASLSLAPTTTRAYGTTSEMSPSPSLQIIIPTTSSVFGTTSSVQLNGPSQSFLLQTIASTFDATIQTSTAFPNTNEASLSLAPTTTRAYGTTSEIVKMSPSPSLQTNASSSKNTVQAAIASSDTDQSSLSLMLSPTVSDAYGRSSKVIEGSPSSPSADLFSGNSLKPTIIQSMRAEISTSQLSTMTTEHHPSPTPLQPTNVPVVTFANSPLYSNGSIFISWVFESVASTQCTLITPSSVLHPPCIESYSATNLIEGIYTLIVTATSVTGYTALPVAHSWTVDLTSPVLLLTSYPSASSYYSIWNFTFNCVNEWKCSYSCSLELSNTVEKYVLCDGGYFIAENLQVGQEYMFSVFAVDGVGNIGNPAVYKWKFDTQLTSPDTLANQQLYTVYGTAAGILAAAIILVIIIAALCTLITIRRKSRSRVLLTVGYRQDRVSQQTAEHCIDKEKIFLEEMYKKESAEIPNTTFIENEHTTTL